MDVVFPSTTLTYLPFSAEAINAWDDSTDLAQFIHALYADHVELSVYDGHVEHPPIEGFYSYFASKLYANGQAYARKQAKQFTEQARLVHESKLKIPNFYEDSEFGRAMKYFIAWERVVQAVLEEAVFYSLAHVLESEDDLKCSLFLAASMYYKQGLQTLRSFLEDVILPIHFCATPQEYSAWKANNYRVPPMRGRDGLLNKLVAQQILPNQLADDISSVYNHLNSYIHGSEGRLVNKGVHTGNRSGLQFNRDDFYEWCEYLAQSVDLGVRLLRISGVQWETVWQPRWESLRAQGKILCSICHNENDFDITNEQSDMYDHIAYRCRQCGYTTYIGNPLDGP